MPDKSSQADFSYLHRNKIINTLTFMLKVAAQKDTKLFLALLEIDLPRSEFKLSNLQWNKLFLTIVGILRVLIDNNKKLILHMLKSLIQKDEYFVSKGDHVIDSHSKIMKATRGMELRPPLADIIQIMRDESQEYHKNSKNQDQTE
mgnify:CR=1 FL=1